MGGSVGGLGAFAGGLAGGFLSGEENRRANKLSVLQEQAGARAQKKFDKGLDAVATIRKNLKAAGYLGLADQLFPDDTDATAAPDTMTPAPTPMFTQPTGPAAGLTRAPFDPDAPRF